GLRLLLPRDAVLPVRPRILAAARDGIRACSRRRRVGGTDHVVARHALPGHRGRARTARCRVAITVAPATGQIMTSVPLEGGRRLCRDDTSRELGGALGIAILGTIANTAYRSGAAKLWRLGRRRRSPMHSRSPS